MNQSALTLKRRFSIRIKKSIVIETISGLFILLFVYTAISKLFNHHGFESVISRSPLIEGKAHYVAWGVPIVELIISLLLFIPKVRKWGLYASSILMLVFTAYLFYIIYFTPNLPCSCGGVIGLMSWKQHLVFNIVFTLLGIVGSVLITKKVKQ